MVMDLKETLSDNMAITLVNDPELADYLLVVEVDSVAGGRPDWLRGNLVIHEGNNDGAPELLRRPLWLTDIAEA